MKKLIIAAVAVTGASVFGAIESQNICGYSKKGMKSNTYTMYGANFQSVGNTGLSLQDLSVEGGFTAGSGSLDGDEIEIWRADGSKFYYYDGGMEGEDGWPAGWYDKDDASAPTEHTINPGEAIWFYRVGEGADITFPGEVFQGAKSLPLKKNTYSMFTIPYPTNFPIGDLVVNGGATAGSGSLDGDEIEVWKLEGSKFYYYDGGMEGEDGWPAGWYDKDDASAPTEHTINPGEACWYYRVGEATTLDFDGL